MLRRGEREIAKAEKLVTVDSKDGGRDKLGKILVAIWVKEGTGQDRKISEMARETEARGTTESIEDLITVTVTGAAEIPTYGIQVMALDRVADTLRSCQIWGPTGGRGTSIKGSITLGGTT